MTEAVGLTASQREVDRERVLKYISMAEEALSRALDEGEKDPVLEKATRYIADARYYLSRGDEPTALSCVSYAHGLIDGHVQTVGLPMKELVKPVLAHIYVQNLQERLPGRRNLSAVTELLSRLLADRLVDRGLVTRTSGIERLTPKGRRMIKVGLGAGVFDILHPGHVLFLEWCRSQVDVLCVVVARDHTSFKRKGRFPVQAEEDRLRVLAGLQFVDYACLGDQDDRYSPVLRIQPDVIFLGRDQEEDEDRLRSDLADRGLTVEVRRSPVWDNGELSKTTRILERIRDNSLRGEVGNRDS